MSALLGRESAEADVPASTHTETRFGVQREVKTTQFCYRGADRLLTWRGPQSWELVLWLARIILGSRLGHSL